ncbi:MAG: proton-conducting transporter membrane subunit [Thermoplasmata archaeon]|nr:proton-conducting transporter membrane subunit [Thermoplasmata archaeon]
MDDILFMMVFPFIVAVILLVVKNDRARAIVSEVGAAVIIIASVWVAYSYLGKPQTFEISSETIDLLMFAIEAILGLVVIYLGVKYKKYAASVLGLVQLIMSIAFEFHYKEGIEVERGLYIDDLSILMILIIGIIGSLICVYAVGYMRDFQAHAEGKDRRPWFFFLLFVFLSAMYGIVLSDNLVWMFFFWEITTLCSFALIGFTKTEEAINNSFRQLILNLIGGISFLAALILLADQEGILSLAELLATPDVEAAQWVLVAVMLMALAGIVKSAQMPFHTWLLGAMVAPTPTSALLHSSTMVKAGVFMLLKLSPLLCGNVGGYMVMTVGALTFLLASMAAISQSNAKRVLAYSTIANLGLIVACAGVGTPEAVWAGVLLMVFHAITKSMLFLCVGTAEHHIGSRNIEDMDNLFDRMPRLALIMMLGIAAMFLAPLGMLISKWAALTAFVDPSNPLCILLVGCIAFGSAVTGFYWTKWLGKLACTAMNRDNVEKTVRPQEWSVLGALAVLVVVVCFGYPLLSDWIVVPWIEGAFGWDPSVSILENDNMYLLLIMMAALVLMFLPFFGRSKTKTVPNYMSGVNIDNDTYEGSMGSTVSVSLRNWYLEGWFGENYIGRAGEGITAIVIIAGIALACAGWVA